jgi:hypothetical protein
LVPVEAAAMRRVQAPSRGCVNWESIIYALSPMGRRPIGVAGFLALCAATAAPVSAGDALAKTPQLIVGGALETGASATTTVQLKEAKTDAAPLAITIYMPTGYTANLSQAVGTQIGTVTYKLQLLASSVDAVADASGTVLVADRSSSALQASATQCSGTPTHAAIWLLHADTGGQTLDVPVYVDTTTGTEAAFSSAKLVLCLPNPYEQAPPGTRAPGGVKIFDTKATLSAGVIANPIAAGAYVWRAVVAPWSANGPSANPAGAMEAQGIATIPSSLTLKTKVMTTRPKRQGKRTGTNSVLLSGKLLEKLQGVAGARLTIYANGKTTGSTTTNATGAFSRLLGLNNKTTFNVTAAVPTTETACVNPLPVASVPAGCVSATFAGYRIGSDSVDATPRR